MTGRNPRDFDVLSEAQIVAGLTSARSVSVSNLLDRPASQQVGELLDAINQVAEAATGDRSFLHVKSGAQNRTELKARL